MRNIDKCVDLIYVEYHPIKCNTRWLVCLCTHNGHMLFSPSSGKYDVDAATEYGSEEEAKNAAIELADRRGACLIKRKFTETDL
jgi:hypothetical protein